MIHTQFFYFFGKFLILKMIHNPFKVSVQSNRITEIIATLITTCYFLHVTHRPYSTMHSHTVCWRNCEVSMSHLQSLYGFLWFLYPFQGYRNQVIKRVSKGAGWNDPSICHPVRPTAVTTHSLI